MYNYNSMPLNGNSINFNISNHQTGFDNSAGSVQPLMLQMMMTMAALLTYMSQQAAVTSSGLPSFGSGGGSGGSGLGGFLGGGSQPGNANGGTSNGGRGKKQSQTSNRAPSGKLVDLGGGKKVDASIAGNVRAMIEAARRDGVELKITSANRSRQEQEVLYQKYLNGTGNLAAKPGTSNHEGGLAIDFTNTPGAHAWLAKNAGRFGLKNLPGEPWHYSTTGR